MLKYLLIGLGVVSVAALGLYALSPYFSKPVTDPNNRVVQVAQLMEVAQNACLSERQLTGKAGIDAAIETLSGKGEATTQVQDLKGAVDVLNETLKLQENAAIRDCMKPYADRIFDLINPPAPASDATPRQLNLQFSLAFADPQNPLYDPEAVYIGEKLKSAGYTYLVPDPRLSAPPNSVYVYPNILLPSQLHPYSAILHRVIRDAYRVDLSKGTEICLINGAAPPAGADPFAWLDCDEATGQCKLKKPDDPGWVDFCPPMRGAALTLPGLVPAAFAADLAATVWNAPSLETLSARTDLRGVGYTKFEIIGPALPGEKIDAVVLGLKVNGTPVLIDGVDPEYRAMPYDPAKGLDVAFALQNLDFAGVNSGCDTIEASIQPVADGKIAGAPIVLKRPYVALRNAESVTVQADEQEFTWTGTYVTPQDAYDYAVIVNSVELSDLSSEAQLNAARQQENAAKQQVDRMNLTFQGMRVVGVVRPPLSKPSFGTALGIVEPSGQIRFTFDQDTAKAFKASAIADAARIPGGSKVVQKDAYVYPYNKKIDAPKGICPASGT